MLLAASLAILAVTVCGNSNTDIGTCSVTVKAKKA